MGEPKQDRAEASAGEAGVPPAAAAQGGRDVQLQAVVEMLRREMDASRSVSDHLQFLNRLASGEPVSPGLREHLLTHIGAEEAEHQAHLARLLPVIESLQATLGGGAGAAEPPAAAVPASAPPAPGTTGLTVGSLIDRRPWYNRPSV